MIKLLKILFLFTLGFGVFLYFQYQSTIASEDCVESADDYIVYIVEEGETFASLLDDKFGESLYNRIYLRQNPPEFGLQAGKYEIPSCVTYTSFIENLQTPINETDINLTILEGWNVYDIDLYLAEQGFIEESNFASQVTDPEFINTLKADYPYISDAWTLEGFLYPDTYAINPDNFSIEILARKMLDNFEAKLINTGIITDMGSIEIIDILNMASIVQKETAFKRYIDGLEINKSTEEIFEEASTVAGVLKKRLDEGWQIGADATVCYAHEIATQNCTPTEVLAYLYDRNEYNTRAMVGLPVGPIANPQALIVEATINSTDSPYYYYLHAPNGQIYYGVTNADHERNKNLYLR